MLIPIVIGAIALGRSFDMKDGSPKPYYIYDNDAVTTNTKIIPRTFTQSQYRLIESSSESNDLLNVNGDFSLKVKNGMIGLQGYGKYMTTTVNRDKTVEMLITVYHETETDTFPSYIKLNSDWQQRPQSDVGTHYIRSITYGGQLIISYQLKAKKDEYMEEIKAAVTANLAFSGKLDANVTGKLEKLAESVKDISTVSIQAYATAGTFSPPTNLDACLKLVEDYPKMVSEINNKKGAPLKLEIVELSTLQSNYSAYLQNFALDGLLNAATNKFDDLRIAMQDYKAWDKVRPPMEPEKEKIINAYQRRLKDANQAMSKAISNLDSTGDLDQFDEAFKAYGEGPENIPNRYSRDLKKLIATMEEKSFFWFPYTKAVSHYVHWGSINCSLPSPEPIYIGYATTSPKGFGNGGNVMCLKAKDPSLDKVLGKEAVTSQINGLLYELPDKSQGQVLCSFCKLENATVAYTIAGRTECPNEMKLEYEGYLSTSRDAGTGSSLVCLDRNPDEYLPAQDVSSIDKDAASLVPLWMQCPDCDEDENKKYVSCVVCSR